MQLADLPTEILDTILEIALNLHSLPAHVLCVNSTFRDIGYRILYTRLHFSTIRQLYQFSRKSNLVPHSPREVTVALAGGIADFNSFHFLSDALRKCLADRYKLNEDPSASSLPLDSLRLCLHSHVSNPYLYQIYNALTAANPKTFTWTGPDPGHHFSTAIVPTAVDHLFRAIATWNLVETVKLTNISFPHGPPELPASSDYKPLLPPLPRLRHLYLGQATYLPPGAIAATALQCIDGPDGELRSSLEQIRLVDAYQESIWGKRLRRTDVERAALALPMSKMLDVEAVLRRIRSLVQCEAMNERIMGGDRSEGLTLLE
ncbi:hypothetical protein BC835DRAFT_1031004 [Cytidiella melzeri]|nr:hypothetical protein BC835DRAFT_1031004 [Cytidiella melzeri]